VKTATPRAAAELDEKVAGLVQLNRTQRAVIEELTAQAEARKARVAALERQVAELQQQLVAAAASGSPPSHGTAAAAAAVEAPGALESAGEWQGVDDAQALRVGDVVRYRVPLIDAWRGTTRRSKLRTATVAKLLPSAPDGPSVVLQQASGAMDCVETSQLSDLQVRGPR